MKCPICDGKMKVTGTKSYDKEGRPNKDHPVLIKRFRACTRCKKYKTSSFEEIESPNTDQ